MVRAVQARWSVIVVVSMEQFRRLRLGALSRKRQLGLPHFLRYDERLPVLPSQQRVGLLGLVADDLFALGIDGELAAQLVLGLLETHLALFQVLLHAGQSVVRLLVVAEGL